MAELFTSALLWNGDSGTAPAPGWNAATGQYYFTQAQSLNYAPGKPIAPGDTVTLSAAWGSASVDPVIQILQATGGGNYRSLGEIANSGAQPVTLSVMIGNDISPTDPYPAYINVNGDNGSSCQVAVAFGTAIPLTPWIVPPDPYLLSPFLFGPRRVIVSVVPVTGGYGGYGGYGGGGGGGYGGGGMQILFDGLIGLNQAFPVLAASNAPTSMPAPTLTCDNVGNLSLGFIDPPSPQYTDSDVVTAYGNTRIDVFMLNPAEHVQMVGVVSDLIGYNDVAQPAQPATFYADSVTLNTPDTSGFQDSAVAITTPPATATVGYDTVNANPAVLQLPIRDEVGIGLNYTGAGG